MPARRRSSASSAGPSAGGRQTALDRAHERVARIAAEHRPPELDPALDAELRRLAGID